MHRDLIDELGGPAALAVKLETSRTAVFNWRTRGIPWKRRHTIARLAAERGLTLPEGFWAA